MAITLEDIKKDLLEHKYRDVDNLVNMIDSGETEKILNPAYNLKYKAWVEEIKSGLKDTVEVNIDTEEFTSDHQYEMAGCGGVGSNILYMLEHLKFIDNVKKQPYNMVVFEGDEWDYSNLPRIPIIPNTIKKADTFVNLGLATHNENEDDISEMVFMAGCQIPIFPTTFFGAVDLQTRQLYNHARIPFIGITHRDDELRIVLNPTPPTDTDLSVETYGMVDVNFFIPAAEIAGIFMFCLITKYNEYFEKLDNLIVLYKDKIAQMQLRDIFNDEDVKDVHAYIMYYGQRQLDIWKNQDPSDPDYQKISRWSMSNMFNILLNPEKLKDNQKKYRLDKELVPDDPLRLEIIKLWNEMQNLELLKIDKDLVKEFLKCKNTEDALRLLNSNIKEF